MNDGPEHEAGTQPMRVVHVVHSLQTGGMENGVVNVARELTASGEARVSVICLTRAGPMAERFPVRERVLELRKPEGLRLAWAWKLARAVRQLGGAEVIHTHNLGPLIYAVMGRVAGLRGRILHGEHAVLTPAESTPVELRRRRWLYRRAEQLHTVSGDMTRQLQELRLDVRPVATLLNGVDTRRFHPAGPSCREALPGSWPADARIVLMVARFGEHKGHERLLDAWPEVLKRVPNARLVLVGSGGPREASVCERVAGAAWRETVYLAGHQSEPEPWYRAAHLLILPSTNEGLSNVTLEAMACGCPVLSHDSAGAAEIVTSGVDGEIRKLDTAAGINEHLGSLLAGGSDPLARLGAAARSTIEAKWSLDRMVAAYAETYRSVIASHRR